MAGYVGSDTIAAAMAAGMDRSDEVSLLLDIGTNGEIAQGGRGRITCCAAARAAFEGAHIKYGSGAVDGAIDRVWTEDRRLKCHAIGGGAARSICGSGLVDAVAALLELELIDETGRMDGAEVALSEGVALTQRDVREVQLAKGAIAAGIDILMKEMGVTEKHIAHLYLAGGFGNYIEKKERLRPRPAPPELLNRATPIGTPRARGRGSCFRGRSAPRRSGGTWSTWSSPGARTFRNCSARRCCSEACHSNRRCGHEKRTLDGRWDSTSGAAVGFRKGEAVQPY